MASGWSPSAGRSTTRASGSTCSTRAWPRHGRISEPGIFPFLIDLSLDDRWVAVVGPTRATTLYPTAGGPAVPLPELGDLQPTGWSKEGHLWVKDRDKIPTRLVRFDVERRKIVEDQEISPEDPTGVVTLPRIRLTPDGKTMVYDYRRMLDYLYLVRGPRRRAPLTRRTGGISASGHSSRPSPRRRRSRRRWCSRRGHRW